jgi:hypothetical protein
MNSQTLTILLILGLIVIAAIAFLSFRRREANLEQVAVAPFVPNPQNDKVIFVSGWSEDEIRKIIADFAKTYENQGYPPFLIEHQKKNENLYRLSFPQDIHPVLFAFLVDYVAYPFELDFENRSITVGGKSTLSLDFAGIDESLTGQRAIFYLPENDQEGAVVYMRTESEVYFANSFEGTTWERVQDGRLSEETKKFLGGNSS